MLAGAAAALIVSPAIAGSHGGGKKMKMDCATKLQKMEKKGMTGGPNAELYKTAQERLKAGDEKGCMEAVARMKKAMKEGKGYGKY